MYKVPIVPAVPPAAFVQPFCKRVSSISVQKLGVYSTNPIKLTKKGPLRDVLVKEDGILEEIEQMDTNVFKVDIVDEDGNPNSYTIIVPEDS